MILAAIPLGVLLHDLAIIGQLAGIAVIIVLAFLLSLAALGLILGTLPWRCG